MIIVIVIAVFAGIAVADLLFYLVWSNYESGEEFGDWADGLTMDPKILGGAKVFPNTRLSVVHVGEMLERGDICKEELQVDYPCLTDQDLKFAKRYAKIVRGVADAKAGRTIDKGSFIKYTKE
jgi:uncharacterized protein (DUF433 family)